MNQIVWTYNGKWQVAGKVPVGEPVDDVLSSYEYGTPFPISVGGLVVFRGVLG